MSPKLFSELIITSKIKPDSIISKNIDELDFPLKHVKFIKKDINNLLFSEFTKLIDKYKSVQNQSGENLDSINNIELVFNNIFYKKTISKIRSNPNVYLNKKENKNLNFDILTPQFMDEINKLYILFSLCFGASLHESIKYIETQESRLQSKKVYQIVIDFWTNFFKNDFTYFLDFDYKYINASEEVELEHSIVKFHFNHYKSILLNLNDYTQDQKALIEDVVFDKQNFKWYVIFGFILFPKLLDKGVEPNEDIDEFLKRFKKLNFDNIENFFDLALN